MVDADAILAAEGIITIALSLVILAVGIKRWAALRSDEARLKFIENWASFRLAMVLFGGSLFLYLIAETGEAIVPSLPRDIIDKLFEPAEPVHMLMLILAVGISARVAMRISTSRDNR